MVAAQGGCFQYHALRHLGASPLDAAGVPMAQTQRILGPQDRRTNEGYVLPIRRDGRDAMEAYARRREESHAK